MDDLETMPDTDQLTFASFLDVVVKHQLWGDQDRILIGISAGPDSVALAQLAFCTGQLAGLAHVNYHLREEESDLDEQLIRELGARWQVPVYVHHTSPEELANLPGHSLQMAARTIRYDWWNSLLKDGRGTRLLTGHHADDQIETVLLHWIRGTGLAGWTGMPMRRGPICRPLLPFTRDQILHYLKMHDLPFRLDKSNDKDDYLRNRLRHHVVPELKKIQPQLTDLVRQQCQDAQMALLAADQAVEHLAEQVVNQDGTIWSIQLDALRHISWASFALYRWLQPKGFNRSQIQAIHALENHAHGQVFRSSCWEAVIDRGVLLCKPIEELKTGLIYQEFWSINDSITCALGSLHFEFTKEFGASDPSERNRIIVDKSQLQFPLILRNWQPGDRMRPYGLSGTKKIKDILIDEKTSAFAKQETLVLTSGQNKEIIWLIGHRVSQSVQPGPETTNLVILRWVDMA